MNLKISIIILTYNRRDRVKQQMDFLSSIDYKPLEIIFVDNCSDKTIGDLVLKDQRVKLVRNSKNLGAVGRNRGMEAASGDIIITLDDDVYGISNEHLDLLNIIMRLPEIAAVNFKVVEEGTNQLINWCHPYDLKTCADKEFETNEISEGAVSFRKKALDQVGYYPEYFFISHEGPDLALRLINKGWKVVYDGRIAVVHGYDSAARKCWRRYYFDTRNLLWVALRNLSWWWGFKRVFVGWGAMLIYSLRDGYFIYWCRAVLDSARGARRALNDRTPPTKLAKKKWKKIEKQKPTLLKKARERLFQNEVRI